MKKMSLTGTSLIKTQEADKPWANSLQCWEEEYILLQAISQGYPPPVLSGLVEVSSVI